MYVYDAPFRGYVARGRAVVLCTPLRPHEMHTPPTRAPKPFSRLVPLRTRVQLLAGASAAAIEATLLRLCAKTQQNL